MIYCRWWTRITGSDPFENDKNLEGLCRFAAEKLRNFHEFDVHKEFDVHQEFETKVAFLDVRLGLRLSTSRDISRKLAEDLVENHMRVVYSVPRHKEFMLSGYPSEPVLAEAAARVWNSWSYPFSGFEEIRVFKALQEIIEKDCFCKDDVEELIGRFMFLRAQDVAVLNSSGRGDSDGTYVTFSKPTTLWYFLSALLPKHASQFESGRAKNDVNNMHPTFREACEGKFVRFSHFARAADSSILSTAAGWKALARANAWQCHPNQESVDIVIPIFIAKDKQVEDGTLLGRQSVTFLLVQVNSFKRRQSPRFSAESLGLFKDRGNDDKVPYFVITINLEADAERSEIGIRFFSNSYKENTPDPQPDGHPCYWIEVDGYSNWIFNFLVVTDSRAIGAVLAWGKSNGGADDPEQLQRLKLAFGGDDTSFGWAKEI